MSQRAGVCPIGHRLSLRPQADLWPTSNTQPGLPFNGLHPCNPCNCIDYYSFTDPGGMEGWVGLVGWPIVDTLPSNCSHVNHRSGKVCQPKTDTLTTEPRHQHLIWFEHVMWQVLVLDRLRREAEDWARRTRRLRWISSRNCCNEHPLPCRSNDRY